MSDELIKNRIALMTPEYQDFITSDHLAEIIRVFAEAEDLDETRTNYFENGLILYLLFFITAEQFKEFVSNNCDLDQKTASSLVEATIRSLPEGFDKLYDQAASVFLGKQNDTVTDEISPTPPQQPTSNPLVRPVPQSPYAEVPTYESSQADIYPIRKRPDTNQQWGVE